MDPGLAFGPLGLVPAIFLLYITLGPYENKFKDKIIFLSFIGGMIIGTVVLLLELSFLTSVPQYLFWNILLIIALLFSFLDQLSKLIILNLPRFHTDITTSIYGASFGLGSGVSIGVLLLREVDIISLQGIAAVSLVLSFMFFQSATGSLIGLGVGRKKKWTYFFYSLLMGILFWPLLLYSINYYYLSPIPVFYATGLYIYMHTVFLPPFLLDRKTRKKKKRQKTKRKLLGKI